MGVYLYYKIINLEVVRKLNIHFRGYLIKKVENHM